MKEKLKITTISDIVKEFKIPTHSLQEMEFTDSIVDGINPRQYGIAIIEELTEFVFQYYKKKAE